MSTKVKPFLATTFTACALLLAGCTTYEQPRSLPAPTQPQAPRTAVDGQWRDKDGIISSFSAGKFETRTTDSNQVLAVGSYNRRPLAPGLRIHHPGATAAPDKGRRRRRPG